MTERGRYRELAARLNEERERLEALRADYRTITRSRFHALRMVWFSLKQLFGIASSADVYAVWSTAEAPSLTGRQAPIALPVAARAVEAALGASESTLVEAWNARVAARAMSRKPIVSVVIPSYDGRELLVRCLLSIAQTWFETLEVEFIVADDGSTDGTAEVVARLAGVDYVRTPANEGFVRACNRAASLARGTYVCFLNNDTVVGNGWLDHLVSTAEGDASIGVVGAKLVYPDGRLQEAGGIVWRDGSGWNVGRYESPQDPRYNFVRDVDYVSGAAMLVRKSVFESLGGFSERYRPAYYEDTDLCFGARALGYRVVYQPRAEVAHVEGASSGDERTGVKRFQEIHRETFLQRWGADLAHHLENDPSNVAAASRREGRGVTVLVIDSYVPLHDRESGSQRMLHVVKMLRKAGYGVVFLPDNYAPMQPYTDELQQLGVEVLHHVDGGKTAREALEAALPSVDIAWISRPELYEKYAPFVRRNRNVRVIYDTVDLCHVRKRREAELLGTSGDEWREMLRRELEAAGSADATVVVTAEEKLALEDLGMSNVCVVPNIHEYALREGRRFGETSGLLFIGNYNHPPNVDAVQWLCRDILPLVWKALPDVEVTLVGSNPSPAVLALKSPRVRVTGYVRDPSMYFRDSRLFVAPLRFGAGMKGKIGHALQYALPAVTTPIGAEGLGLRDGEDVAIAPADAQAFADAVVALYGDEQRWNRLSRAARRAIEPFAPAAVMPQLEALLERLSSLAPV